MLTLALAATLLGFVLLILGLITGTVWLAVACIVVCLVGLGFLLVDVFAGRKGDAGRSLEDMVPGAGRDTPDEGSSQAASQDSSVRAENGSAAGSADAPTRRYSVPDPAASDDSETVAYRPGSFEPGMAAPEGSAPPNRPAPERREGNLEDYLRSVGVDAPSAGAPTHSGAPEGVAAPGGRPDPRGRPTPQPYGSPPPGGVPQRQHPGADQPSWPQQRRAPGQFGPPPDPRESGQSQSPRQPGRPPVSGQRPPAAPSPGRGPFDPAQSGWVGEDVPGGDAAGSDDWATSSEHPDDSASRRRRADFDPLDPNWHPPPD